jgi:hypothetical protein
MDGIHSRRFPKNFLPFWELIKINITGQIEVKMGLYLHRCNIFRSDTIPYQNFTNDQDEVETIKRFSTRVNIQVGELRIRRENDGLSRDYRSNSDSLSKKTRSKRFILEQPYLILEGME